MNQSKRGWRINPGSQVASALALQGLPALLQQTLAQLEGLGADFAPDRRKIEALQERLAMERFHLAVLGQFKRGKSTLLNALIGEEILPTSVVPLTAIPTFILWGPDVRARVIFLDDHPHAEISGKDTAALTAFLAQFVTEADNPENRKGVSHVEVFYPASLLQQGVVLIDTPGIGSTFRHNTEATLNFLPQCDAALFLVSPDPPITEVEVEFLKAVKAKITRLFFIINKVDYVSAEERDTLVHFIGNVLREQAGTGGDAPVFCVSARQGLEARKLGRADLWTQSGLEEVRRYLIDFLARDKASALREALARKALDAVAEVLIRLRLAMRSLEMPLTELDERLRVFETKMREAERERILVGDLLAGDRKRMVEFLEEQAENLRQKARVYLEGIVQDSAAKAGNGFDENKIQETLAEAIPAFFEHELGEMARTFDLRVTETLRPHQQRADDLIEAVRKAAAELFEVPYHAPSSPSMFEMTRQPYWVTHKWETKLSPIPDNLLARLLPLKARRSKTTRLMKQVGDLVINNVENLRWTTLQNLDQAFRRFSANLDERLQATIAATHGAIRAARARRLDQVETTAPEIARLQSVTAQLQEIQAKLEAPISSEKRGDSL